MLPVGRLEDLALLEGVAEDRLVGLIKAALGSLEGGAVPETDAQVGRQLTVISFLLEEAARLKSSETDFRDSLVSFPLSEQTKNVLCSAYLSAGERIRGRLQESTVRPPHYKDLDWRMDVELASRALRRQTVPTWLFKLTVESAEGQTEDLMLQTDAVNLAHLYEELQVAFGEQNAAYAKRIQRNVK